MQKILDNLRQYLRHLGIYVRALAKWLLVSALVGTLCGLIGSAFHVGVEYAAELRAARPWIVYTLPAAGLLAVAIYRLFRVEGQSTNDILAEIQSGQGLRWPLLPAIFLTSILTHLAGGSAGREGRRCRWAAPSATVSGAFWIWTTGICARPR